MTSITTTILCITLPLVSAMMLTPEPTETDPLENKKVSLPAIPDVELALIEGFDDIESYDQSMFDRLTAIKNRIDETKDLNARIRLRLAEANHILAYLLEPACTTKLLRIDAPIPGARTPQVQQHFERADRALEQADQSLKLLVDSQENPDIPPDEDVRQFQSSLGILRAFARAQRAYLLEDAEDPKREARRAATGLSALVEHNDAQIKSAALFWQGCLRGMEDDPSSALSRLDYALQNISKSTLPFSYYSRILRCNILADHGSYTLTLSLLLQMQELSRTTDHGRSWFFDPASRQQSSQTISLLRIQTLHAWHEKLDEKTHEKERGWCAKQMQQLIDSQFDGKENYVMRLLPAIPIIAPVPE